MLIVKLRWLTINHLINDKLIKQKQNGERKILTSNYKRRKKPTATRI